MLVSFEWLSDFLDIQSMDSVKLADKISRSGIEVEGVINYGKNLSHLIVGEVISCVEHENSDHLKVTQVDIGESSPLQIVCGAPNVHQGAKVIVALQGCELPGGFKIKKSKLRGVESYGMLCSLQELGFKDSVIPKEYANGLYLLPQDAPIGESVVDYLQLDDPILELSITPNRADALSLRGAAYEIGAVIDQKVKLPNLSLSSNTIPQSNAFEKVTVSVEDKTLSPHYQLRLIENVTVQPSPLWLQMRLMKAGIRPINNLVDVTNYALLLYGQPMHAFDLDALPSGTISVQLAQENTLFTTLDEVERTLTAEDMVIVSGETPVALAGVMGGLNSQVTESTTNILLETAVFDRQRVRKTSNKFNLRSESSMRFEKGINLATINEAGEFAAQLIAELGNGVVVEGVKEVDSLQVEPKQVTVAFSEIQQKIGIELSRDELVEIMNRLGFELVLQEESFTVSIPPRRWDIEISADVLEEIARIYGYDRLPTTLPTVASTPGKLNRKQHLVRKTRSIAEGMGLNQVISYVLTSSEAARLMPVSEPFITLALPMSEERSVLRQSLFPALLEITKYNEARKNRPLAFYEIGKVFLNSEQSLQPIEQERFALMVSGAKQATSWYASEQQYDFYVLKGMLETYFETIRVQDNIRFVATSQVEVMHPGRTAFIYLEDEVIGIMGQIHPNIANSYDISIDTYFAEVNFDRLLNASRQPLTQQPIPKFPATSRDLALLVPKSLTQEVLMETIQENGGEYLVSIELFDRFVDLKIGEENQSLAYHLVFQDANKTLTDEEVSQAMQSITQALLKIEGLEIR